MPAAGLRPSAGCFSAVVTAFGRCGRAPEAARVLEKMWGEGCEAGVEAYHTAIEACAEPGRRGAFDEHWRSAAAVPELMASRGVAPTVDTFMALLQVGIAVTPFCAGIR